MTYPRGTFWMVNHFWSHFGCWDIWIWISRRNFKSIQIWLHFNRPFPQKKKHNPNKHISLQCTLQCKQTITQKQFLTVRVQSIDISKIIENIEAGDENDNRERIILFTPEQRLWNLHTFKIPSRYPYSHISATKLTSEMVHHSKCPSWICSFGETVYFPYIGA